MEEEEALERARLAQKQKQQEAAHQAAAAAATASMTTAALERDRLREQEKRRRAAVSGPEPFPASLSTHTSCDEMFVRSQTLSSEFKCLLNSCFFCFQMANQIDMQAQSELMASFEENL